MEQVVAGRAASWAGAGAARAVLSAGLIVLALVAAWEAYKGLGAALGGTWPGTDVRLPVRPDDRTMPHTWEIVATLFEPARRGGEEVLLVILARAAFYTWRIAVVGFLVGSVVGLLLAVLLVRSRVAMRGLMPYVIASQTVPVLAIAPLLISFARREQVPIWVPVAFLSAYLAFYPVTIAAVRGLRSPATTATELFRSYAAPPRTVLLRLQLPAALPFLFPALRIAATASVIGAIVGELPAGQSDGLARQILSFASSFSAAPEKLFASVLVSALLGVLFVGLVALVERLVVPAPLRHTDPAERTGTAPTGTAPTGTARPLVGTT
ncbi:ABC transporter permease [Aquipuribacter nitratireducens]|uniref:ABC transporter permease n=1 Tax=Aquipuribacter nitratireducens TaxID=650104 RepID=A0ABW0GHR6_9MICO